MRQHVQHRVLMIAGGVAVVGVAIAVLLIYIPQVVPAISGRGPEIDAQQQSQVRAVNIAQGKAQMLVPPVTQQDIIDSIKEAQAAAQAQVTPK